MIPEYDSNDENEELENDDFPGFTRYHYGKFCCIKNAIFVDNLPNKVFLGHWDFQPGFPLSVTLIIVSSYLFGMIAILPTWSLTPSIIIGIIHSITFILFIYSYYRIIIDGPGYFPFYWPLKHVKKQSIFNDNELTFLIDQKTDENSPSGIISTKEQADWAKGRIRPNRSIMAGNRIVIRPDHFCGWTSTFIGKRNYKFFLLFNFWGFVYISDFIVCCIIDLVREFNEDEISVKVAFLFLFASLALFFLMMTGSFTGMHVYQMLINQTLWEEQNKINESKFDRGVYKNIEDVCGPWSKWYTFLLPISPWTEFSNVELVKDYSPYFERRNKDAAKNISKLIINV